MTSIMTLSHLAIQLLSYYKLANIYFIIDRCSYSALNIVKTFVKLAKNRRCLLQIEQKLFVCHLQLKFDNFLTRLLSCPVFGTNNSSITPPNGLAYLEI